MSKKCKVDWSKLDGSLPKAKRLHLEKDEEDHMYHCLVHVFDYENAENM